jgi:hypothetical protein
MTTFNREQWIDSFEGQLSILRPHLTQRVLTTMSLAAWHEFGAQGHDPIEAARALHEVLGQGTAGQRAP